MFSIHICIFLNKMKPRYNVSFSIYSKRTMQKSCGESVYQTNVAYGITNLAIGTDTSADFSQTHNTEQDSPDKGIDMTPNEAYSPTSAGAQMTVCTTDNGCVYQTNVAYGISNPIIVTDTSAEFSPTHNNKHDSQDMDVNVTPNEAYGVTCTLAEVQMTVCTTEEGTGESVCQTNVAHGITSSVIGTDTSAEFSPKYSTEHDSQDVDVDVTPNEAYGVTSNSAGAQN